LEIYKNQLAYTVGIGFLSVLCAAVGIMIDSPASAFF